MKLLRSMSLLPLACLLIFAQTGLAADGAPSFNWTGPYAGLHLGYGWGNTDTSFSPLPDPVSFSFLLPTTLSPNPSGIVGGLQGGYNYQTGCIVVGIEADFSGSGMSGTKTVSPIVQNDLTTTGGFLTAHQETNWYGTLRPRMGYTVTPTLLVYGTVGLAYGDVSYSAESNFQDFGVTYPVSFSKIEVGWTAGGGLEYALCKHWTVKAEYLYIDLGSESAIVDQIPASPPFQVAYKWNTTANIFNIGLNYKF